MRHSGEDIAELYDAGWSVEGIAHRLDMRPTTVRRALLRRNRIVADKRRASVPADTFVEFWNAAPSARVVMKRFGSGFDTVTNRAYRLRKRGYQVKLMTSHLTGPFSRGIL